MESMTSYERKMLLSTQKIADFCELLDEAQSIADPEERKRHEDAIDRAVVLHEQLILADLAQQIPAETWTKQFTI
jgi:hypothetical protein